MLKFAVVLCPSNFCPLLFVNLLTCLYKWRDTLLCSNVNNHLVCYIFLVLSASFRVRVSLFNHLWWWRGWNLENVWGFGWGGRLGFGDQCIWFLVDHLWNIFLIYFFTFSILTNSYLVDQIWRKHYMCWAYCYPIILCSTVWIFWQGKC